MAINVTAIGLHTVQITAQGETNSDGILDAINTAIISNGWELYDAFNSGTQRIYRGVCKDGVTSKYFGMFFDPIGFRINTTAYESWNKTTHVGTNEVATYNRTGQMHFTLSGCDIIVMVSPRWLVLQTFIRNSAGPWAGLFECSREAAEDTPEAGYPPFMWMTSVLAATYGNNKYASFPRNRANQTGTAATADGWQTQYIRLGAQTTKYGADLVPMTTYAWDTSKKIVQSLRPTFGSTEIHGKVFGLKAVSNIGAPYTRVSLPIDSDYQFSVNGTAREHWVLANTPSFYPQYVGTTTSANVLATGTAQSMGTCTLNGLGKSMVYTGVNYYISTSTNICKVDGTTQTLPANAATVPGVATADYQDVAFDGRYVYASSPTGVVRLDTQNNDAVTTLTLPSGSGALFFDGTYLWAGSRVAVANNSLWKIDVASFTLTATLTLPTTSASYSFIGGMCTDFAGNLYVPSDSKLFKVVIATNAVSQLALTNSGSAYAAVYNGYAIEVYVGGVGAGSTGVINMFTTTGSSLGSTNCSLNNNGTMAYQGASHLGAFKIGAFNGICHQQNMASSIGVSLSNTNGLGNPANSNSGYMSAGSANATTNTGFAACDGGRFYHIGDSKFTVLTNICHPDDANNIMNRFLLPK